VARVRIGTRRFHKLESLRRFLRQAQHLRSHGGEGDPVAVGGPLAVADVGAGRGDVEQDGFGARVGVDDEDVGAVTRVVVVAGEDDLFAVGRAEEGVFRQGGFVGDKAEVGTVPVDDVDAADFVGVRRLQEGGGGDQGEQGEQGVFNGLDGSFRCGRVFLGFTEIWFRCVAAAVRGGW
jgi:hypothetical protein